MRSSMRTMWLGLLAPLLLLAPKAALAETFTDEELGYSIHVPQAWRAIPIAGAEKYIVAKWQSDKEYFDKKQGFFSGARPELKVILFDPKGKKSADVQK